MSNLAKLGHRAVYDKLYLGLKQNMRVDLSSLTSLVGPVLGKFNCIFSEQRGLNFMNKELELNAFIRSCTNGFFL